MKLLLTAADSSLGRGLKLALGTAHDIRATGAAEDFRDPSAAAAAVSGREAVVHLAPLVPSGEVSGGEQLDRAARETYNLLLAAVAAGSRRFVLLSTLRLFDRYPPNVRVSETLRPRPTTEPADLAPYLAELVAREVTRVNDLTTVCLRLATVVEDAAGARPAPPWVHIDDVAQAVDRAVRFEPNAPWPGNYLGIYHIAAPGSRYSIAAAERAPVGYTPEHALADRDPAAGESLPRTAGEPLGQAETSRPHPPAGKPRRVVVYGAGGPLGAAAAEALAADRVLRLTDVRPLAEIAEEAKPQSLGAPIARPYPPPHEEWRIDVGDEAQVVAAAVGMDAIVNCSVVRTDLAGAFRVNLAGAYNVCLAAVTNGIRRIVHTGPQQTTAGVQGFHGYAHDFAVPDDAPARPGAYLYLLTKYLGQEVCRTFAEERGLEVPALLFTSFLNPEFPRANPAGLYPMAVSWNDAAAAIRGALDAPCLPHPFEPLHILTDLPHGKYPNERAKRILNWQPRDDLRRFWQHDQAD